MFTVLFLVFPIVVSSHISSHTFDINRELSRIRRIMNTNTESMCIDSILRTINNTVGRLDNISLFDISLIETRLNLTTPAMMIHISPIPSLSCVGRPRKIRPVVEYLNRLILKLNFIIFRDIERNERLNAIYRMLSI